MTRRKENVRKSCDTISSILNIYIDSPLSDRARKIIFKHIKSIKRTTWRGDSFKKIPIGYPSNSSQDFSDGIKYAKRIYDEKYIIKKPKSKIYVSKDIAKRINTNQTTTANIDVSAIPYY